MDRIGLTELILLLPFATIFGGILGLVVSVIKKGRAEKRARRLQAQRALWLVKGGFDGD